MGSRNTDTYITSFGARVRRGYRIYLSRDVYSKAYLSRLEQHVAELWVATSSIMMIFRKLSTVHKMIIMMTIMIAVLKSELYHSLLNYLSTLLTLPSLKS